MLRSRSSNFSSSSDPLNGINESPIESSMTEESALEHTYFPPEESTMSSQPQLFLTEEEDVLCTNMSKYSSTNGFSTYYSTWQSTTNAPDVSPMEVLVKVDGAESDCGSKVNHDNSSVSLPLDFIEVSQLNKDCIIVYTILFVFAAVGNLLVLYCVSRYDRLGKSRTPLLIMNLCIADLIVTFFLMPTEIFWRFTIAWKGGDVLCKLSQFVRAFGMYLSSNVVICISVDRYYAIIKPLKLAGAVKRVKWMLVAAWIVSAGFAGPQMFVYHVASHPVHPEFRQCVTKAFVTTDPYNELIYNVSAVSALYIIPLIVIIYTYTMILWKIHQKSREHRVANSHRETLEKESNHGQSVRTSSNHLNIPQPHSQVIDFRQAEKPHNLNRTASKRTRLMLRSSANQTATLTRARSRTLRLSLLIIILFIICWTPTCVMTLWYMLDRRGASQVDERLQEALFIMAVTNSVLNPLIYGTVGRKQDFKKRFQALVRSSSLTHRFFKHACCCGLVYEHCCEQDGRRNSETVIITLNRTNGGGSSRSRSRMGTSGHGGYNCSASTYPNPPSPTPTTAQHHDSELSPRSQIVTLKCSSNVTNPGFVTRFIRIFTRNNQRSRLTENTLELRCARGIKECAECGSKAESEYIVPPGQPFVSQYSTQL